MGVIRNPKKPPRPKRKLKPTVNRPKVRKEVFQGTPEQRARAHYAKLLKLLSENQLVIVAPPEEVCSMHESSHARMCVAGAIAANAALQ